MIEQTIGDHHSGASGPPTPELTVLRVEALSYAYPSARPGSGPAVADVTLQIDRGEFVAIVGRNGCGKSTLLSLLAGALPPTTGRVHLRLGDDLVPIAGRSPRIIARDVAFVHQSLPPLPGVGVRDLVQQGRFPHRGVLGMLTRGSDVEVEEALEAVGMDGRADDLVDELSGGERQRVRLALALAQQPSVLMLDEPTAHLDIHHQLQTLALVDRLRRERGLTVIAVLHELDHALRFASRLVAMRDGAMAADGPPDKVLDAALLATVYDVRGRVRRDQESGRLTVLVDDALDV